MSYKHGVFTTETETSVVPPLSAKANITVIVGIAAINQTDESNVNKIQRLQNLAEAEKYFGKSTNPDYTINAAINAFFKYYSIGPIYAINVLDPAVHKVAATPESLSFVNNQAILATGSAIMSTVAIKVGAVNKTLNVDYSLSFNNNEKLVVSRINSGSILSTDIIAVTYDVLDYSLVTSADIIGGISGSNYSGLELVDRILPKYNEVIGQIICPVYCKNNSVAAVMTAKAKNLTTKFKAMVVLDLNTATMATYSDAPSVKALNSWTDKHQLVCVGDLMLSGVKQHFSIHLAALNQLQAKLSKDKPVNSPSNKNLVADGFQINSVDITLDDSQAEYVNSQGLIIAINDASGWLCWGNRTAAFPSNTDIKDCDIAVRQMFNWVENTYLMYMKRYIDAPIKRRNVQTGTDSFQLLLNSLCGEEALLSGRIEFRKDMNPTVDLLAGVLKHKIMIAPSPTGTEISGDFEYDVNGLNNIF